MSDHLPEQARHTARKAGPWITRFARLGYAAKGVVYVLIGILAVWAAIGFGGEATGSRGALRSIVDEPFGLVILTIIGLGLLAYAAWQFLRAIKDPEGEGDDTKALAKRAGFFISGIIHLGLVVAVAAMVLGVSRDGAQAEDQRVEDWTAWLMSFPFGQWLVAITGLIIGGYGVAEWVKAYRADLDDQLSFSGVRSTTRRWAIGISRIGLAGRGVIFVLVGLFLVVAAWQQSPDEAVGLSGALQTLHRQAYGRFLLGVVALGLVAYGIYEFILARYRRIQTS